jgi:23S rRNA pseudouridine1911/1915/1917 synthase
MSLPANDPVPLTVTIDETLAGDRLDKVLHRVWPDYSRTKISKSINNEKVTVDGLFVKAANQAEVGQKIVFWPPPADLKLPFNPEIKISVIYQDQHIFIINKMANLPVHPCPGLKGPTLLGAMLAKDPDLAQVEGNDWPALVHRLDKDTTGVMVIARSVEAHQHLLAAFHDRNVTKKYLAFVRGRPAEGLMEINIARDPQTKIRMSVQEYGRLARTWVKILKYFPKTDISFMELTLLTGRTHQARVQMAALNTPILGDKTYAPKPTQLLNSFPFLAPYLKRHLLHARRLAFVHPQGHKCAFRAPWPADFIGLWQTLKEFELS